MISSCSSNEDSLLGSTLVLLLWTLSSAAVAYAAPLDWPQYRGPSADGTASADLATTSDLKLNEVWRVPTPLGFSSFSIADGKAYTLVAVDDVEHCVAFDAATGNEQWRTPLGKSEYGHGGGNAGARNNRGGDGPRSTPTINDGRIYAYDAEMHLVCLDASDGSEIWRHDILNEFGGENVKWLNAVSPVIEGDRLFTCGGGEGAAFLAFNKTDGKLIWKSGDETMTHATPVVRELHGQRQIIYYMESGLVAIDPANGSELWRAEVEFRTSSAASPIVDGDLVYCSAGYGVGAAVFRISDTNDVEQVWSRPNRLMNHWSTPVLRDGFLYGLYGFKDYGDAPLCCVELATGETKWSQEGFGQGNLILVGDDLIVLSDAGELVIVKATPDAYQETMRTEVLEGKCWSTPAFSDGRLFVRSTQEGACLGLKDK